MRKEIRMVLAGTTITLVIYTVIATLYSLYTETNLVNLILVGVFSASVTTMFTLLGMAITPRK